jgi:hypothetical protein
MRRDPDFFGEQELALVYLARRLKNAVALEKALDAAGLDYAVETDSYLGGLLFPSERIGAYFYVRPESESAARQLIHEHGFKPYDKTRGK